MPASKSIGWTQAMQSKSPVPLVGRQAIKTPLFNTCSSEHQSDSADCEGCAGRDISTSGAISISIFREDFVGKDSLKVKPADSRFLETIYEENEEETDGGGKVEREIIAKKTSS